MRNLLLLLATAWVFAACPGIVNTPPEMQSLRAHQRLVYTHDSIPVITHIDHDDSAIQAAYIGNWRQSQTATFTNTGTFDIQFIGTQFAIYFEGHSACGTVYISYAGRVDTVDLYRNVNASALEVVEYESVEVPFQKFLVTVTGTGKTIGIRAIENRYTYPVIIDRITEKIFIDTCTSTRI